MNEISYFRLEIDAMNGYTPGEQPKIADIVKLNTNENPYPPAPGVEIALKDFATEKLRLYPDPQCNELRHTVAKLFKLDIKNIIAGNGSDDILTMIFRCFTDTHQKHPVRKWVERSCMTNLNRSHFPFNPANHIK